MIHRSFRAAPYWAVSLEPLAPLATTDVRHVCRSLVSPRLSAARQSDGRHIAYTDVSTRSCLPSSARPCGNRRCVDRCWPSTRQTRRSATFNWLRTKSMQARRREGNRSFLVRPPTGSICPVSAPLPLGAGACSPSGGASLFCAHPAVLLLPATIGLRRHADLSDCINLGHALPRQNSNLPRFNDNLFGLGSLYRHLWPSAFLIIGVDHFFGGLKQIVRFVRG